MVRKFSVVLIVDDSQAFRVFCKESIKSSIKWIHILEAKDGIEALKQYQLHKPDLILLDIKMPRLDGTKVLELIKKNDSVTKILVTSAFAGDQDSINKFLKLGATAFVPKPMNRINLMKSITEILAIGKMPGTNFVKDLPAN